MINMKRKDLKLKPETEFKLLKLLDNPFLLRHIGDDFYFDDFYCFLTEFCQVIYFSSKKFFC